MADIIVSLTKKGREMEAQALLYGYGFRIDYFSVGSGGHDPGNSTLALPLDLDVTSLPGEFFGPEPLDKKELVSSTCPRWTAILQPGEAVGQISNFGLTATVVFVPNASLLLTSDNIFPGPAAQTFLPGAVDATTETISLTAHGFVNGDQVVFSSTGTLPGGLAGNINYYIVSAGSNTFKVSLTNGGSAVNITDQGTGTHSVRSYLDDTITSVGHGLSNGNLVNVISNGTMPGGLVSGLSYFVVDVSANTFKLSDTLGGAPVDITTAGSGVITVTNLDSVPIGAPEVGSTFLYALTNFPARFKLSSVRETYVVTLQT